MKAVFLNLKKEYPPIKIEKLKLSVLISKLPIYLSREIKKEQLKLKHIIVELADLNKKNIILLKSAYKFNQFTLNILLKIFDSQKTIYSQKKGKHKDKKSCLMNYFV